MCTWTFPLPLRSLWPSQHSANLGSISRPCVQWVSVGFGWHLSSLDKSYHSDHCVVVCVQNGIRPELSNIQSLLVCFGYIWSFLTLLEFNPITSETKLFMVLVLFFRASYNDLNEKHQPDAVNKYVFHLCSVSTCFGQHFVHHHLHARIIAAHTYLSVLLWNHHYSFTVRTVIIAYPWCLKSHKIIVITFILHTVTTWTKLKTALHETNL